METEISPKNRPQISDLKLFYLNYQAFGDFPDSFISVSDHLILSCKDKFFDVHFINYSFEYLFKEEFDWSRYNFYLFLINYYILAVNFRGSSNEETVKVRFNKKYLEKKMFKKMVLYKIYNDLLDKFRREMTMSYNFKIKRKYRKD
jgi:hypothetical protein